MEHQVSVCMRFLMGALCLSFCSFLLFDSATAHEAPLVGMSSTDVPGGDMRDRLEFEVDFEEPFLDAQDPSWVDNQLVDPEVSTSGSEFLFLNLLGDPRASMNPAGGVRFTTATGPIELKPLGTNVDAVTPVRARNSSAILFKDAYPAVDLALVPTASGLNFLFHKKSDMAASTFEWTLDRGGAAAEEDADGSDDPNSDEMIADVTTSLPIREAVDIERSYEAAREGEEIQSHDQYLDSSDISLVSALDPNHTVGESPSVELTGDILRFSRGGSEWSGFSVAIPWAWQQPWESRFGGKTQEVFDDLLKVRDEDGTVTYTHGPDNPPASANPELPAGEASYASGSWCVSEGNPYGWCEGEPINFVEKEPVCSDTHNTTILYAYDDTPLNNDIKFNLREAVRDVTGRIDAEHRDSGGGGARLKVRCNEEGVPAIWQYHVSNWHMLNLINEAQTAGYRDWFSKWLIFTEFPYQLPRKCGIATTTPDDSKWIYNLNNVGNRNGTALNQQGQMVDDVGYAMVYKGCWRDAGAWAPLHELLHTMGAVAYSAPHSNRSYHCRVTNDVMCQDDRFDGYNENSLPLYGFQTCSRFRVDCTKNDYFNATPAPGTYLSNHWNIATSENYYFKRP